MNELAWPPPRPRRAQATNIAWEFVGYNNKYVKKVKCALTSGCTRLHFVSPRVGFDWLAQHKFAVFISIEANDFATKLHYRWCTRQLPVWGRPTIENVIHLFILAMLQLAWLSAGLSAGPEVGAFSLFGLTA
jgi:hypothetical protein